MVVYLGCYTNEANVNGLKALDLDEKSGTMAVIAESSKATSCSR